ncbi:MAG: galactose-1-phosphate uridylyltransferase, partial [Eubacterium sp.]|nr:galactose-1-phosphate uridylyltransferase [Eubacterium sp.]
INSKDISADEKIAKHAEWAKDIMKSREVNADNCVDVLKDEIGNVFTSILEQCGVYKRNDEGRSQFIKFMESVK